MKHKIAVILSALFMALTTTACGSGEPASAPSVADSDKVVIPFNTHEGSGESGTYSAIGSYLPNTQVLDGMAIQGQTAQEFSSDTQQSVRDWLDGLGF